MTLHRSVQSLDGCLMQVSGLLESFQLATFNLIVGNKIIISLLSSGSVAFRSLFGVFVLDRLNYDRFGVGE